MTGLEFFAGDRGLLCRKPNLSVFGDLERSRPDKRVLPRPGGDGERLRLAPLPICAPLYLS